MGEQSLPHPRDDTSTRFVQSQGGHASSRLVASTRLVTSTRLVPSQLALVLIYLLLFCSPPLVGFCTLFAPMRPMSLWSIDHLRRGYNFVKFKRFLILLNWVHGFLLILLSLLLWLE